MIAKPNGIELIRSNLNEVRPGNYLNIKDDTKFMGELGFTEDEIWTLIGICEFDFQKACNTIHDFKSLDINNLIKAFYSERKNDYLSHKSSYESRSKTQGYYGRAK